LRADGPRHPGPRPAEFEFPFALGRQALAAMEAELDELEACVRSHDDAGAEVCAAAEGASATAFEAWLSTALQQLVSARTRLADDVEALRTQLALAEERRADRQQAITTWERRMRDYRDHEVRP
jgi:outer membrane murein-binding lipoprotein Lpp